MPSVFNQKDARLSLCHGIHSFEKRIANAVGVGLGLA